MPGLVLNMDQSVGAAPILEPEVCYSLIIALATCSAQAIRLPTVVLATD